MVCVHTYSESDNTSLRYGRLKFSKMAAGRHLEFDANGNGAVGSVVPENPTLEPNMRGSVDALQSYGRLKFSQNVWIGPEVGRWSSSSVGRQYSYFLHWFHILIAYFYWFSSTLLCPLLFSFFILVLLFYCTCYVRCSFCKGTLSSLWLLISYTPLSLR